ncbi:MAG: hypothetical protein B6I28_05250, partial [Fusobacteriia bacterium 4572_132]
YRTNGVDKDVISYGGVAYDDDADATPTATVDTLPLWTIKNFAYQQTGYGTTATSTVYIVLGSKQLTGTIDYDGAGAVVGTSSSFTTEVAVGDYIELFDSAASGATYTVKVSAITDDTHMTVVEDGVAVPNTAAGSTYAKAFRNVVVGKHFEVLFADYEDDTMGGAVGGLDDGQRILCDQHGNAINASVNNYLKGNAGVSW